MKPASSSARGLPAWRKSSHGRGARAERGSPTRFDLVMRMPAHLSEEQVERLQVIAAKCPVHRTLEGEVAFDERVELT